MRGYLWEDLQQEIAEEFLHLSSSFDRARLHIASNNTRGDLREDHLKTAKLYDKIKFSQRRTWGDVLRADVDKLVDRRVPGRLNPTGVKIKDRCKHGHNLRNPANVAVRKSGLVVCRVCHRDQERRRYEEKKMSVRIKLPADRTGVTQKFTLITRKLDADGAPLDGVQELKGYITASVYPQLDDNGQTHPMAGKLGEIFVKVGKPGASTALLDEWAVSLSRELQRGADPAELCRKHRFTHFEPSGQVRGIDGIKSCTSPTDLVTHWIERKFLGKVEE